MRVDGGIAPLYSTLRFNNGRERPFPFPFRSIPMKSLRWSAASCLLSALLAACGGKEAPVPPPPTVMVEVVGRDHHDLALPGEVRARQESALSFQVPGRLVKRLVDAGDRVAAGQVLAELDASDYALQAQAAQAQLVAAEAEQRRAAADLARYRALAAQQLVSRSALEAQQTAHDAAAAQVRALRAQQAVAANQAGYARLVAPAAGVVASRQAEVGQVLAAGQPVLTLATDAGREVAVALPESRIAEFRLGQRARVELWNAPGRVLAGTLREIAAAADPQTRTYAARVALEQAEGVSLGQSARVYLEDASEGLSVPLAAVQGTPGTPQASVWTVDPATGKLSRTAVRVARWGRERAGLAGGVEPGQWVVAAGGHLLREGQVVRAVDRDNRPLAAAARGGE